jgi:hypothetical protein
MKQCGKCKITKPLDEFHGQKSSKTGKHSYCKPCANQTQRDSRVRNYTPTQKRKWQLSTRYNMTPEMYDQRLSDQNGVCAICEQEMKRPCVDHSHITGSVRGILCHACNIRIGGWDDLEWRERAQAYLQAVL